MKEFDMNGLQQIEVAELEHVVASFKSIFLKYRCALREIETKFEILNDEYKSIHSHNPIEHMKSRIKSPESILEKLQRRGFELSISGTEELTDIAGIRVTCSFLSDVYDIAASIRAQDDLTILKERDYIKNPKDNGYRSLHLVVSIPVYFTKQIEYVPVEIQLRTVSMDTWASLEHKLRYKYNGEMPNDISNMLLNCAHTTAHLDDQMLIAHNRLTN
ncbi:MAG: GTP pyrophosphokinase family protein [Clostridium sp.]|uniref:GTP pyrophosphokinase n=1 Tax=Clostridium sp. TaxID=1506 RepID=UPI0030306751